MSFAIVQSGVAFTDSTVTTVSVTLSKNVAVYGGVYVLIAWNAAGSSQILDTQGNAYAQLWNVRETTNETMAAWWCPAAKGGALTVTCNFPSSVGLVRMAVMELPPFTSIDQFGAQANTTSTTPTSPLLTCKNRQELVIASVVEGNVTITAGAGYTMALQVAVGDSPMAVEVGTILMSGTAQATFNYNSTNATVCGITTFYNFNAVGGWTWIQSGSSPYSSGNVASRTATLQSGVGVGDLIVGTVTFDTTNSADSCMFDATQGLNRDSLGNVWYRMPIRIFNAGVNQSQELWYTIVKFAGVPTVRLCWGPVPATTQNGSCVLMLDHFTGSDINSVLCGYNGIYVTTGTPTSGTDGISGGNLAWLVPGALLVSIINDDFTPTTTITPGTGWLMAHNNNTFSNGNAFLVQYKIAGAPSTVAITATESGGVSPTDDYMNVAAAFSPAATKGRTPLGGQTATVKNREHFNPALIDELTPL